jgi:hypothetical protein
MSQKLPTLDPLAAFVDVGSEHMHVSVGGNRPQVFGTVTSQLHALRDWLLAQGVHSVAMEATGVYWLVRRESRQIRCFTAEVGGRKPGVPSPVVYRCMRCW